jgi:pimeloyl-ACP methyl ester carboxylesterase
MRIPIMLAEIYVLLLAGLWIWQRHMMYFPTRCTEPEILRVAATFDAEPWKDSQGTTIGWRRPERKDIHPANRLIIFHGNAGYALDRVAIMEAFERIDKGRLWEVYLFEYPSYGARAGGISESEFRKAGAAAIAQLRAADSRPIYVAGESVGSGTACAMAHDMPDAVAGLVLITPFTSMVDAAGAHFPWVPVSLIVRDRWNNKAALPTYHGPVAILAAGNDHTVPPEEARTLFGVANSPKRFWTMPGVDHNDVDYSPMAHCWEEASEFLLKAKGV